ncbi:MAG TPA: Asp-tRNA(Asn)/Glu-tRNA(Gln) amidotransferase subunit GatB [Candidatus Limnocylindria bacterium]|nr:Asp-tRNA(Asn)/Glu-tRNA(Gln) amidotransferase subunit GatB [Candidatus Limnocylindria bacterium]
MTAPYELVIGIECHVELATRSKMFCRCSARWFGAPPNTLTCPVCLGLPGALPVPNERAIELAITAGLALHCEVPSGTKFDRKNYMYPDLPKGYQISQYDLPLNTRGWLEIASDGGAKRVGITRAHLEEDTGKLLHDAQGTLVDFNRSGVPLLEIVSEPDMRSAKEAIAYCEGLREVLIYSGVSEFRLEEGAARFDVNVSIRFEEGGETRWPPQSEIKNLNSFRSVEESIAHESRRLWDEWQAGGDVRRRTGKITVGWSQDRRATYLQRAKEEVDDYRYFPEPDLVALRPARALVERIRSSLPEMPADRRARFARDHGLSDADIRVLTSDRALGDLFEAAVADAGGEPKAVANWITGELLAHLKRSGATLADAKVRPEHVGALVRMVKAGEVSGTAAKEVFAEVWRTGAAPADIVKEKGLGQVTDEAVIAAAVNAALDENPKAVADYKAGNRRAMGALVGAVMKKLGKSANTQVINRVLAARLNGSGGPGT